MADRKYGAPAPATHDKIAGLDWYQQVIDGKEFSNVLFLDGDWTECETRHCVFNECTFRHTRFNTSVHRDAAFLNCTFVGCNFFDAQFIGCKLLGSMFNDCEFHHMRVSAGDWGFVGLPGADLRRTHWDGTRLREADLTGARCQGAGMRDVDLSGAWLHSADFSECDLRGSDLGELDPQVTPIRNAVITIEQTIAIAQNLGFVVKVD